MRSFTERQRERLQAQIADREDYRNTLIERQESTETKISRVEEQLRKLRTSLAALGDEKAP